MRHILLLTLAFVSSVACAADNDTVVINKPNMVTVITNDSLQKVIVRGKENDDDFVYRNTIQLVDSNYVSRATINRDHWSLIPEVPVMRNDNYRGILVEGTVHFYCGFIAPLNMSDGLGLKTFRSANFSLVPIQFDVHLNTKRKRARNIISLGIGLDWKMFGTTNHSFMKDEMGRVALCDFPEGSKPNRSGIRAFSLCFPLLYQHRFGHGWQIGMGPVFNWNCYSGILTEYDKDEGHYEFTQKHIGQRKFTIDYLLQLRTPLLPVYMKYSNMNVLKDSDVKFHALSFGLYF